MNGKYLRRAPVRTRFINISPPGLNLTSGMEQVKRWNDELVARSYQALLRLDVSAPSGHLSSR